MGLPPPPRIIHAPCIISGQNLTEAQGAASFVIIILPCMNYPRAEDHLIRAMPRATVCTSAFAHNAPEHHGIFTTKIPQIIIFGIGFTHLN